MKPQTALFISKARDILERADAMQRARLSEDAGRAAYLAGFHAAQATVFEAHDRVFKTHSAVKAEFSRLVKGDVRFDGVLRSFLGRSYNLKTIADYETGPDAHVTVEQAGEAITAARRFVDAVEAFVRSSSSAG